MKRILNIVVLTLTLVAGHFSELYAQVDSTGRNGSSMYSSKKPYHIKLRNGSSYTGFILRDDAREILLRTTSIGEIYIQKSNIESITEADKIGKLSEDGKYFGIEDYYTRYGFLPSAFSLEKDEVNLYMPYFMMTHAQYGVTDNLDLGVGTSWFGNPLTLTAKYSFKISENRQLAIGGMGLTTIYGQNHFGIASGYAMLTQGRKDANISIGAGYGGFKDSQMANTDYFFLLGAYKRFHNRFAVVLDGLFFPNSFFYFGGPGLRYFRKRKEGEMIDFGFIFIGNTQFQNGAPVFPLPYISYIITL